MEFKGTKGKWDLRSYTRGNNLYSNTYVIKNGLFKEHDANALLISKAPELLDFVNRISAEMLRNDFVLDEKLYYQARQLITDATTLQND